METWRGQIIIFANGQNKSCQCFDDYKKKKRKKQENFGQCYCIWDSKAILKLMM